MIKLGRKLSPPNLIFHESHQRVLIRQHLLTLNILTGIIFGLTCLSAGAMEQQVDIRSRNIGNVYILANFLSSFCSIAVAWQSRANSPAMFHIRDRLASIILGSVFASFFVAVLTLNFREMLAGTWKDGINPNANDRLPKTMLLILLFHLPLGLIGLVFKIILSFYHSTSVSNSYVAQVVFDVIVVILAVTGAISRALDGVMKIKMTLVDELIQVLLAIGIFVYGCKLMTFSLSEVYEKYERLLSDKRLGESLIRSRLTAFDSDEEGFDCRLSQQNSKENPGHTNEGSPFLFHRGSLNPEYLRGTE